MNSVELSGTHELFGTVVLWNVGDCGKPDMESLRGTGIRTKKMGYSSSTLEMVIFLMFILWGGESEH